VQYGSVTLATLRAGEPAGADAATTADSGAPANADQDVMFHKVKANKILFLGNSITLHGPAPAIGWLGNWGMAASTKDNDYVHLMLKAIAETAGREPQSVVANIATFERQYATFDVDSGLKQELAFKADLVIVAMGENVPAFTTEQAKAAFKTSTTELLKKLKESSDPVIVVRSCFWPDQAKDAILKQACEEVGGIFVDAGARGKDEAYFARSERQFSHAGVAAHPGDRGMKAIADAILEALRKNEQ
jgi:hypothetical protein